MKPRARIGGLLLAAALAAGLGATQLALGQGKQIPSGSEAETPPVLMTRPVDPALPNAAQVQAGQALAIVGDCVSCHTREDGEPLAGGLGLNTPFGVIYTPNITSDADTGLGAWTPDQFWGAMHSGLDAHGRSLYPAFPYVFFSRITRADSDAILAYLKTTPAVRYTPPADRLPFPFNLRFLIRGWNLLFFREAAFQPDPSEPADWNRGAFLVNSLGHCGQCHTPVNLLGATEAGKAFQGGDLDNWVAPDLTSNRRTGLGSWTEDDIVDYLRTGRNLRAQAAGAMAEVVSYSTSLMTDQDVRAMAVYLKSLPPSPDPSTPTPDAGSMRRGAAIYSDACASCHLGDGRGQPGYFPPLGPDAVAQQSDPAGLLHLILAGARTAPTTEAPSPLSMPSFAWKLSDQETADVATFLRNSWGNRAAPVTSSQVAALRSRLGLQTSHLTVGSGDHER